MVTAVHRTLNLHYNGKNHRFISPTPIGEMAVKHCGNAIRIYWNPKAHHDTATYSWQNIFEIAIDDIGFDGATVHPIKDFYNDNLQDDLH